MKKITWNTIKRLLLIILGNMTYSAAVAFFILPSGIITGGTTGIALFANYFFHIPISTFVLLFNIVMFLLGFWILGKSFALTTILSSLIYPAFLEMMQKLAGAVGVLTTDMMLCTIFGGLLIGLGIGLVIRAGASTGGMDIPPLILNKKLGLPVSVMLYVFDITILVLQMIFSNREQILFGILLVCIYSFTLEKVLVLGNSKTQLEIISKSYEEISNLICTKYDRGATLYEVEGGYTRDEMYAVLSVVNDRELFAIKEAVMKIDPAAFIIISKVNEVRGRGFTLNKVYGEPKTDER